MKRFTSIALMGFIGLSVFTAESSAQFGSKGSSGSRSGGGSGSFGRSGGGFSRPNSFTPAPKPSFSPSRVQPGLTRPLGGSSTGQSLGRAAPAPRLSTPTATPTLRSIQPQTGQSQTQVKRVPTSGSQPTRTLSSKPLTTTSNKPRSIADTATNSRRASQVTKTPRSIADTATATPRLSQIKNTTKTTKTPNGTQLGQTASGVRTPDVKRPPAPSDPRRGRENADMRQNRKNPEQIGNLIGTLLKPLLKPDGNGGGSGSSSMQNISGGGSLPGVATITVVPSGPSVVATVAPEPVFVPVPQTVAPPVNGVPSNQMALTSPRPRPSHAAPAGRFGPVSRKQGGALEKDLNNLKESENAELQKDPALAKDAGVKDAAAKVDDAVKSGDAEKTLEAIENAKDAVKQALDKGNITQAEADQLTTQLNELATITEASALAAAVANGTVPGGLDLTSADLIAVIVPTLPAGQVLVLGDDAVVVGTGGTGQFGVGTCDVEDLGIPIVEGEAVADSQADALAEGQVLIVHPSKFINPVSYQVSSQAFSMAPGQHHELLAGRTYTIQFDRGNGTQAYYALEPGTYEFTVQNAGWELVRQTYTVTLDNSANGYDFHYVVDGETASIPAGEAHELTSAYPIIVTFDRGDGSEPARKKLLTGTYLVGVDPEARRLDLFEAEPAAAGMLGR